MTGIGETGTTGATLRPPPWTEVRHNTPDQQLVMYTAAAGSPSQDALDLLAMLTRERSAAPTTQDGQRLPIA